MNVVVYQGDNEWSALYVDNKLDTVGDHYYIDERIRELFGVETVCSDDFMRGGNEEADVAQNLGELNEYTNQRESRESIARELQDQAQELLAKARELDPTI